MGSFSSPWVREQLPSLATFKKAFRARTTLIRGKRSGKVPEEAEASSARVYTMQAISLPFDSSRNLFLQVISCYMGFSNVNYALAEVQNPARTLRIAGPLAISAVTVLYLLCNLSYFAAASKEEITGSGRLVVSLLFKNVWGSRTERVLSGFVALSALGTVLSVVCTNCPTTICLLIFIRSSVVFTGKGQSSARSRGYPPIQQGVGFKPALWSSAGRINPS